jgi:hypothetical protein
MIELRRKKVRPISRGDVCNMTDAAREFLKATDDYSNNGNTAGLQRNYMEKIHPADVEIFYCCNDNAFNSSELIEIVPVRFIYDGLYSDSSFKIAMKKRMKLTMKREDFLLILMPNDIESFALLHHNIEMASKKFNLNLEPWKNRTINR